MAAADVSMATVPHGLEPAPMPERPALTPADYNYAASSSTAAVSVPPPAAAARIPYDDMATSPASSPRASPLRKGKWTPEEEAFTSRIIHDFTNGYLPLAPGTTLRSYLSEKLNCDPMRITKKFAGAACIGKQVFQPCENTPENHARIADAHDARASAERLFLSRLEHAKCPRKSALAGLSMVQYEYQTKETMASLTYLASSESMGQRPSFLSDALERRREASAETVMSDKAAGGLLLDFFAAVRQRAGDDEKMSTNGSEESDDQSERDTPRDRKRSLSLPELAATPPAADDDTMEEEERPTDREAMEIKRTKSLSDLELSAPQSHPESHPEGVTTCA